MIRLQRDYASSNLAGEKLSLFSLLIAQTGRCNSCCIRQTRVSFKHGYPQNKFCFRLFYFNAYQAQSDISC